MINKFKSAASAILPTGIKQTLRDFRRPSHERGREAHLGRFVLSKAEDYARVIGGDASALRREVLRSALTDRRMLKQMSEAMQFLQTAMQPDFEGNLFDFYRQQQYSLLINFISYPFRGPGSLNSQIVPYDTGARALSELHILDYGAGIPYGLLSLALTKPDSIRSVTIVDLDLVHTKLSEFIIRDTLPATDIKFIRAQDPNALPDLTGRRINFLYGKDVFEHLTDPMSHLENMLGAADSRAVCFFDLNDHGERYLQHVSPKLTELRGFVAEIGFRPSTTIHGMTMFER